MKVEIDLSEIFQNDDGECISIGVAERVEAAIIAKAEAVVVKLVKEKFDAELNTQIPAIVSKTLETIMEDLLDKPFIHVDKWGSRGEETTVRKLIVKDIESALVWKESRYDNEKGMYNKVVGEVVAEHLKTFGREFTRTVDQQLIAECMKYAIDKLRGGIK